MPMRSPLRLLSNSEEVNRLRLENSRLAPLEAEVQRLRSILAGRVAAPDARTCEPAQREFRREG
jgi:hypothetical protein